VRLATARKLSAHAAVGFAFASISAEGDVPLPLVAIFAAVLIGSYFADGRLGRGRGALLTALTGVALAVLAALWLTGALDLVVSASLFAAALAANRLLSRQSAADDGLLHLSALLMLAGGAALSADLLYGVFFACFSASATTALTLSHLSRAVEEARTPRQVADSLVSGRLLAGLTALSVAALGGAIVIFFAFPRFTSGAFIRLPKPAQGATVGFSEELRLDVHGVLKSDPRPVMRFRVNPDPGREHAELLWKGKTFDFFDGTGWQSNAPRSEPRLYLNFSEVAEDDTRFTVEVLGTAGTNAVFQTGRMVRVDSPRYLRRGPRRPMLFFVADALGDVRVRPEAPEGLAYYLRARAPAGPEELRGRGTEYPEGVGRLFLQLPVGLDPRIAELARRLTAGIEDPYDKALAVERELRGYRYTTTLPGPTGDPLAHFLFERKAGHCEFFSTAMAVLLRAAGVPTRNVTGFFGGIRDEDGTYVVRAGDAHSWTEVFFPGVGFVPFDATPPEGRLADTSSWLSSIIAFYERASGPWRNFVVDLSFWDQVRAIRSAFRAVSSGLSRFQGRTGAGAAGLFNYLGAAIALALALAAAKMLWRRPAEAERRAQWKSDKHAARLYRVLLRRLAARGFSKARSQTARELARAVADSGAPFAPVVEIVTERYLAARFGGRPLAADDARRLRRLLRF
jgi:transglutaminase-like putative cysteine protease